MALYVLLINPQAYSGFMFISYCVFVLLEWQRIISPDVWCERFGICTNLQSVAKKYLSFPNKEKAGFIRGKLAEEP